MTKLSSKYTFSAFSALPKDRLLDIARNIQKRVISEPTLVKLKAKKERVTKADKEIQKLILDYFAASRLAGKYTIKAEESLSAKQKNTGKSGKWQLIIDPLDGTNAFCQQKKTWGVMVGLCNKSGKLVHSWNAISTGELYTSENSKPAVRTSLSRLAGQGKTILIDVYDYGAGGAKSFRPIFEKKFKVRPDQYRLTAYPAAVWAGWKLFTGELDAVLWLPGSEGKKKYPDYDLIFLGAVQNNGYSVLIGKTKNSVEMIVVAPTMKDAEKLYLVGTQIMSPKKNKKLKKMSGLFITSPLY